jgi:hypothetical protein
MADTDLVTLDNLKVILGISGTARDTQLSMLISAASKLIERRCVTYFVKRAGIVEKRAGSANWNVKVLTYPVQQGVKNLYLDGRPINGVTSIVDPKGNTVEAIDYSIIARKGILRHAGYWPVAVDANNLPSEWTITYDAGLFDSTATVEEGLSLACVRLVQDMVQRGPGVGSKSANGVSVSYSAGNDLPEEVLALIQSYIEVEV